MQFTFFNPARFRSTSLSYGLVFWLALISGAPCAHAEETEASEEVEEVEEVPVNAYRQAISGVEPTSTSGLRSDVARILRGYYQNAFGGSVNWSTIESIRFDGVIKQLGGSLRFVAFKKKPDYCKVVVQLPGGGRMVMAYDGEDAWTMNTLVDTEPVDMDPKEARNFIRDATTGGHLLYPALKGKSLQYHGASLVDEHLCYEIEVTLPDGDSLTYFLDYTTFVERRLVTFNHVSGLEEIKTNTSFGEHQGLVLPLASRLESDGDLIHEIEVVRIQTDRGVMPWMFERPSGAFLPGELPDLKSNLLSQNPDDEAKTSSFLKSTRFSDLEPEEVQSILEDLGTPLD
jgi:hypothetical protein